ncbi:Fibronectin type III domain protein [compost metagenome]
MAVSFLCLRGFLILFLLLLFVHSHGQNIDNYSFSGSSGSFTVISGTKVNVADNDDNVMYVDKPIGFDFWYMGQKYSSFSISSNGWLALGSTITNSLPVDNLSAGNPRPIIAPLWDDLRIYPGVLSPLLVLPGTISYLTETVGGSKVLTVQWKSMRWNRSSAVILPTVVISFQAKLYENGNVQFIYQDEGGVVNNGSASIGITSTGTGNGNYRSVNGVGTSPTASSSIITDNLGATGLKPATGQTYTFDPTELAAPSGLNFTRVGATGMRLNWSDNSSGELGFVIYRSSDGGTTYTHLATTLANAIFYDDSGLTNGTTYYYKVYALLENLSNSADGSQLASCQTYAIGTVPYPSGASNSGPVCVGYSITLYANGLDGATYSWTGPNGFSSSEQNPVLNYSTAASGTYTVTVSRNGCTATASTTVSSTGMGQWTGNVSSDWLDANNWCNGVVPSNLVNVSIPASGVANNPSLTSVGSANSINIASGRTLTISGNGNLQVAGILANAGSIIATDGKITFNGTTAQTIPLNAVYTNTIKDLEIDNAAGVTLNGGLRLTGVLTATAGAFDTGGFLTLASSQASTAQVATIPSSASILGNVTVERYVQGGTVNPHRTYRMLSSPVYDNTATFINADVEGNRSAKFSQLIDDIIVSGPEGATNGFDPTHNNNSSSWTYNLGYVRVTNINTAVNAGRGMYFLFRGNRTDIPLKTYPPYPVAETVVMDFEGILNQQDVSASLAYSASSSFNLLGNPYAATIDWDSSNWGSDKGTAGDAIWIWDPSRRAYATYIDGVGTLDGSQYISSGQAFFVKASAAGTIKFKEGIKAITQQPTILTMALRTRTEEGASAEVAAVRSLVRIKMKPVDSFGEDETVIVFDQQSDPNYTTEDASHFNGEVVNISSLVGTQKLAINFLPLSTNSMEIGLDVSAATSGNYVMQFNLDEYHQGYLLMLKDSYLQKTIPITAGSVHNFSVDVSNAQSFGANRFSIAVEPPTVLPIGLLDFTWKKQNQGVLLNWITANNSSTKLFKLYRAGEDGNYVLLADILPNEVEAYSFLDAVPLLGYNYYKLVQVDIDGTEIPTEPIVVNFVVGQNDAVIYPNPVKDKFTIQLDGLFDEKYTLSLYDLTGRKLMAYPVLKSDLNRGFEVDVLGLTSGFYFVKISNTATNEIVTVHKIVKN